jgi:hypothetical protein
MSQSAFYVRTHKMEAFEVRLNHQLYFFIRKSVTGRLPFSIVKVERLSLVLRIWVVPVSNFRPETDYPECGFS